MTGKRKIDIKRAMKYSWIATSISLVQLGLGSYVLYPDYFFTNDVCGSICNTLVVPDLDSPLLLPLPSSGYIRSIDYIIICLVAFVSGYFQWFWFSRIFQQPEIISLHLTSPDIETRPITATKFTRRRKPYRSNLPGLRLIRPAIHHLNVP